MPEDLVLLHGFGATARAWDLLCGHLDPSRYRPAPLDLPGHGELSAAPAPITFEGCVRSVLDRAPAKFALCGYSMGARVALHVALAAPERISRLVLVGAHAGIEDDAERSRRREADHRLARDLETIPYEQFIERWRAQPLFAGDPPRVAELAREDQLRNSPEALAAVLRGIGTGEMEPVWGRLAELTMPLLVIAGQRDGKFVALGTRVAALAPRGEIRVLAGGHVLALELPGPLAQELEGFDA